MTPFTPYRIPTRRMGFMPFDAGDIIAPGPFVLPLAPAAPAPIPVTPIQVMPFRPVFQPQAVPPPVPEPQKEYVQAATEIGTSPLVYVGIAVAGTLALIAILK